MISSGFISSLREWSPMKEVKQEKENDEKEVVQNTPSTPKKEVERKEEAASPMVNRIMNSPLMKLESPLMEIDKQNMKPTDFIDVFNIIWKDQQKINMVTIYKLIIR